MPGVEDSDVRERDFRQRWHRAHIERFETGSEDDAQNWRERNITPHAHEAHPFLETLRRTRDLATFQSATDRWVRNFDSGFSGTGGQMIINQINKRSPDPDTAVTVLLDALAVPTDLDDAVRKIRLLANHLQEIRVGAHPSPKRAPFVASYYWGLEDPRAWPVAWPKSVRYVEYCTGATEYDDEGDRYTELYRFGMEIDSDPLRFERVAAWWADKQPVVIDEILCDRAAYREQAPDPDADAEKYLPNARALVAVAQHIGTALNDEVSEAAGRTLKERKPNVFWNRDRPRGDLWVDWRVPHTYGLAVRVWLNSHGLAIGLRPYPDADTGATEKAIAYLDEHPVSGYRVLSGRRSRTGEDVGFVGGGTGEVIYGRWFGRESFSSLDLKAEVLNTAAELSGSIAGLLGEEPAAHDDDDLRALVAEFKTETGYPTPRHDQDKADRRDFVKLLDPENLPIADTVDLRRIWNTGRYGSTGPMSALNTSVRDANEAEYQRILDTFSYLCWGEDPPETRIDQALEDPALRVKGFGESAMMKMLAICHPDRFITVYPYTGPKGKLRMLKLLEIDSPAGGSRGKAQVTSNDALRRRLDHHFPGDPLGMGSFLYWYAERDAEPEENQVSDPLDELADDLLVDRSFIDDITELLEQKRQVIFYGPPGTGKTFFARKLAEALAPGAERRPIVQFHPSTSYEDFFEGYRPETDADGTMTYRLQKGPLAQLSARAGEAPGRRHVMIIDEINRANLPKVLGELLFLFEYRDTPIRTLYRPDDPFELPKNIWFIGTMNTADRSIALIDAALRRRFHFIPFFPNHGPMKNLLDRWLAREGEPAWVGELVAQVNDELTDALGGPHLQLGASHFMKPGLDRESLRRIWEYDIEPFIEDQFFGDSARIDYFRFGQVWSRFSDLAGESIEAADADDESAS
ncbi:McrB family protein [Rhodococcus sp. SJ-2]